MDQNNSPPNDHPVALRLMRAFGEFRRADVRRNNALDGLTQGEMMILFYIKRAQGPNCAGIKVSDLSVFLRVARPTATEQVNNLVAGGFVEKRTGEKDRRVVRLVLTDKGEALVNRSWVTFSDAFTGLVEYLGEEDSGKLADLLGRAFMYLNSRTSEEPQEAAGLEE